MPTSSVLISFMGAFRKAVAKSDYHIYHIRPSVRPSNRRSTSRVVFSWDEFDEPSYLEIFTEISSHILRVQT